MPSIRCREKWDQNQRDRDFSTQKAVSGNCWEGIWGNEKDKDMNFLA